MFSFPLFPFLCIEMKIRCQKYLLTHHLFWSHSKNLPLCYSNTLYRCYCLKFPPTALGKERWVPLCTACDCIPQPSNVCVLPPHCAVQCSCSPPPGRDRSCPCHLLHSRAFGLENNLLSFQLSREVISVFKPLTQPQAAAQPGKQIELPTPSYESTFTTSFIYAVPLELNLTAFSGCTLPCPFPARHSQAGMQHSLLV